MDGWWIIGCVVNVFLGSVCVCFLEVFICSALCLLSTVSNLIENFQTITSSLLSDCRFPSFIEGLTVSLLEMEENNNNNNSSIKGGHEGKKSRLMISKMELENFKSYAGVQPIGPFHKCFSSIVGPNGSGKSNVIDALLFVFGARAKQLRLNKVISSSIDLLSLFSWCYHCVWSLNSVLGLWVSAQVIAVP